MRNRESRLTTLLLIRLNLQFEFKSTIVFKLLLTEQLMIEFSIRYWKFSKSFLYAQTTHSNEHNWFLILFTSLLTFSVARCGIRKMANNRLDSIWKLYANIKRACDKHLADTHTHTHNPPIKTKNRIEFLRNHVNWSVLVNLLPLSVCVYTWYVCITHIFIVPWNRSMYSNLTQDVQM